MLFGAVKNKRTKGLFYNRKAIIYLIVEVNMSVMKPVSVCQHRIFQNIFGWAAIYGSMKSADAKIV